MSQISQIRPNCNQFKGFSACFTGYWDKFNSIAEIESYFSKGGGIVLKMPDKLCAFLVCGKFTSDINPEKTQKWIKAKELDCKIISE